MSSSEEDVHSSVSVSDAEVEIEQKKRKRKSVPAEDELEIDINLPEPPSKKAKRKEKKNKSKPAKEIAADGVENAPEDAAAGAKATTADTPAAEKHGEYGIWIGNLPWKASKDLLRQWLQDQGGIDEKSITRLHMPPPEDKNVRTGPVKPLNKGFAYVDFTGEPELETALALSEKLMLGRRVLIKNAKSFEGRPKPGQEDGEGKKGCAQSGGKEPSKRVFVGNLNFDVTRDDLFEHFGQAGAVEDVFVATFEDTGKCKGFAWVRFTELEAAEAAVKGFMFKAPEAAGSDDDEEEEDVKAASGSDSNENDEKTAKKPRKAKPRKWFINRLHGRPLRCEFAEDAQTRYKKRYGKAPPAGRDAPITNGAPRTETSNSTEETAVPQKKAAYEPPRLRKMDSGQKQALRRKKHEDARNVAPGKALSSAQRAKVGIVKGTGKKIAFE